MKIHEDNSQVRKLTRIYDMVSITKYGFTCSYISLSPDIFCIEVCVPNEKIKRIKNKELFASAAYISLALLIL